MVFGFFGVWGLGFRIGGCGFRVRQGVENLRPLQRLEELGEAYSTNPKSGGLEPE